MLAKTPRSAWSLRALATRAGLPQGFCASGIARSKSRIADLIGNLLEGEMCRLEELERPFEPQLLKELDWRHAGCSPPFWQRSSAIAIRSPQGH